MVSIKQCTNDKIRSPLTGRCVSHKLLEKQLMRYKSATKYTSPKRREYISKPKNPYEYMIEKESLKYTKREPIQYIQKIKKKSPYQLLLEKHLEKNIPIKRTISIQTSPEKLAKPLTSQKQRTLLDEPIKSPEKLAKPLTPMKPTVSLIDLKTPQKQRTLLDEPIKSPEKLAKPIKPSEVAKEFKSIKLSDLQKTPINPE
jgi:hypothetical protein